MRTIQAAQDKLDAVKATHLANLADTRGYEDENASSVSSWARKELRLPAGHARSLVDAAATVSQLPTVAAAVKAGQIRHDHVREFTFGIRHLDSGKVAANEDWLVDVALTCDPAELHQVMRRLRDAFYPDDLDKRWAKGMDKEDISISKVPDGYHLTGFLSIITGAKFKTLLDSLSTPRDRDDDRPASERRIEALDDMLTAELEHGLPTDLGIRPQLNLTIDVETLIRQQNGEAVMPPMRLDWYGPIGPKLASALLCHSAVTALLTSGNNNAITDNSGISLNASGKGNTSGKSGKADKNRQADILNVGRTARIANSQQRRAVTTRQHQMCATPGCTNPHLEIHHVQWWSAGGATDLDNLIGLCSRCHHLVHRQLLHYRPDGHGGFHIGDTNHVNRTHAKHINFNNAL